jgi:hypothetical protein
LGAALAASTGLLSAARGYAGFAAVYGVVTVCLLVLARATRAGRRVAQWISLVGLGSQMIGAAGAGWELHDPDTASPKARHLRDLGVNFRWALAANLAYSLTASAVFWWAVITRRRSS